MLPLTFPIITDTSAIIVQNSKDNRENASSYRLYVIATVNSIAATCNSETLAASSCSGCDFGVLNINFLEVIFQ